MDMFKILFPPLHKEGWKFVAIFAAATFILGAFADILFWPGVALTIWCYYFFRDPERITPVSDAIVVSAADGVVCAVDEAVPPAEIDAGSEVRKRIGVFMNVFDCHVNRAPVAGSVKRIAYHPGKFLNASLDKASDENERNTVIFETEDEKDFIVTQIAGLVARRILCETQTGDKRGIGERFGIIRFGSRVDIYLPEGYAPQVFIGQKVTAGETIVAVKEDKALPDLTSKTV